MQRLTCLIDGTPVEFVCQAEMLTDGKRYHGTLFLPTPENFDIRMNHQEKLDPAFRHLYRKEVFTAIQVFEEDQNSPSLFF